MESRLSQEHPRIISHFYEIYFYLLALSQSRGVNFEISQTFRPNQPHCCTGSSPTAPDAPLGCTAPPKCTRMQAVRS